VTVVIPSGVHGITKTKDDNINQAMQKAKADAVDAWAEYQFARVKLHVERSWYFLISASYSRLLGGERLSICRRSQQPQLVEAILVDMQLDARELVFGPGVDRIRFAFCIA